MAYTTLHLVVADGDFVFTMSEGTFANEPAAFFDLFLVAGDRIVEHWDIISGIPAQMAHTNGKFGPVAKYLAVSPTLAGRSFRVDFGAFKFRLHFNSLHEMSFAQEGENGIGEWETVSIELVELRPEVYMVYWTERSGTRVVHVEDFANGLVHTNIADASGGFLNLTGTLVEIREGDPAR